jgi:hypothetical protein
MAEEMNKRSILVSDSKNMARTFNYERAATIPAEAQFLSDDQVAEQWGITTRTIRNYRERVVNDSELSDIFLKKISAIGADWAQEMPEVLRAQLRFLKRAADEANPKDPETIHAIAGAYKLVFESGIMKAIVDARLADAGTYRQIPAEN